MKTTKNKTGYFGEFGGSFVSVEIQNELNKIEAAYNTLKKDPKFIAELNQIRSGYQGRPTPLYLCQNLTKQIGGAKIYLKREDLNRKTGVKRRQNETSRMQCCSRDFWATNFKRSG